MNEIEYLLSTKANKESLDRSIKQLVLYEMYKKLQNKVDTMIIIYLFFGLGE